jgi:hypothetical protein
MKSCGTDEVALAHKCECRCTHRRVCRWGIGLDNLMFDLLIIAMLATAIGLATLALKEIW